MVLSPETPIRSGSSSDLPGQLAKDSFKNFYTVNQSGILNKDKGSRNFQIPIDPVPDSPWGAPSDVWEHDESLLNGPGQMQHLNFFQQTKGLASFGGQSLFEGSGDSLRHDPAGLTSVNQTFHDMMFPVAPSTSLQTASLTKCLPGRSFSKETSEKEVKQKERADSSEGSEALEDEDDKGGARSGRRHLSKNLVAERKRRKKLNERLYSLRALVPKITKMDRASILGDAIEYVKELQQQVKDLQDELLNPKPDEDFQLLSSDDITEQQAEDNPYEPLANETTGSGKVDPLNTSLEETMTEPFDDMIVHQPMQVEVNQMDGQMFNLRLFCEKRPGIFVKILQSLEILNLEVVNANVTTFRGLVLNVFNAVNKSKENVQADHVRDSLLAMAENGLFADCIPGESFHPSQLQANIGNPRDLAFNPN